jgi:hypothetical protein
MSEVYRKRGILARAIGFGCLCPILLFGVNFQARQVKPAGPWLDHWRLSTFSSGVEKKDQNQKSFFAVIGTGFFAGLDDKSGYMVTAKHVFSDPSQNWEPAELRIRYSWEEHESVYDDLGTIVRLKDASGKNLWTPGPDGADVAALAPQAHVKDGLIDEVIAANFATKDDVFEGATVIVIGYPGIVGNEYLVRSVIRSGIIAWTDPNSPLEKPLLIDSNIFPGNSGGPVIRVPVGLSRKGTAFGQGLPSLGLISKAPSQETDLELRVPGYVDPLRFRSQTAGIGGIGVVEPASAIQKLLQSVPKTL